MSGALVPSKQEIPVEMEDEIFMQEESGKNGTSKESSSKHHNGNHEEEEDSNEEQVNDNEVKKESVTIGSGINRDTETTKDNPQVTYYIALKNDSSPSAENTSNRNGDTKTVLTAKTSKNSSKTESNTGKYSGINGKNDGINYDAWRNLKLTPSSTKPKDSDAKRLLKKAGGFVLTTGLISGAVIGGTALLLPIIGFGSLGPIAGSMAAAYQSSVGTVAAGSVFSTLQSVGMVGLSAAAKGGIVAGSAVISGASMSESEKPRR